MVLEEEAKMWNFGFVVSVVSAERGDWKENGSERGDWGERAEIFFSRCPLDPTAFQRLDFGTFFLFLNICNPLVPSSGYWYVWEQLLGPAAAAGWCQLCLAQRCQPDDPRSVSLIGASEDFASCPKTTGNCTRAALFCIGSQATQR